MKTLAWFATSSVLALLAFVQPAHSATTVITSGTDAELRAAVANCDTILFNFDGVIVLTNSVTVSCAVTIDATGHAVTLSGGNSNRIFDVSSGASLTLVNLNLANGRVQGLNGNPATGPPPFGNATSGQSVEAGGILVANATLIAQGCTFTNCSLAGGYGGDAAQTFWVRGEGGSATGGAISARGSSVVLSNCIFTGNAATAGWSGYGGFVNDPASRPGVGFGGAVAANVSTVSVFTCLFRANSATTSGGALDGSGSPLTVTNSTFTGNSVAYLGGALDLNGGSLSLRRSSFQGNSAVGIFNNSPSRGGALNVQGIGYAEVLDCDFANNACTGSGARITPAGGTAATSGYGGAVAVLSGASRISQCTFRNNAAFGGNGVAFGANPGLPASAFGGGLYNEGSTTITNCTFALNQARAGSGLSGPNTLVGSSVGGALANGANSLTLSSCTIATNKVTDANTNSSGGGGLYRSGGALTLINSILAGNVNNTNAEGNATGTIVDGGHNISSDASPTWTSGTSLNNTNPLLLPLANNGGPTFTMALRAASSALNNADCASAPPTDQRGFPRPNGPGCDIGAYEGAGTPTLLVRPGTGGTHILRWMAEGGRTYRIDVASHFADWSPFATNVVPANGWIDFPVTNASPAFFRLQAE